MAQLRQGYEDITKRRAEVVVVGPEDPEAFAAYWERERLLFIGVPDPKHTVLKRYGQEVKIFKLGRMPAQVIVDREGVVSWVHYGHSMADIPPIEEILELLDELEKSVT